MRANDDPGSSARHVTPRLLSGFLRRLGKLGIEVIYWEWTAPILLSVVCLIWAFPTRSYIYGQDSTSFINPFSFNSDPLTTYSSLYSSTFPVVDRAPYFYLDSFAQGISTVVTNPAFQERIVLLAVVMIGAIGFWDLLRVLARNRGGWWVGKRIAFGVGTACFLMNPLTLTVIYWHLEGWTFFYSFLPFLLSYFVSTLQLRGVDTRRLVVTLLVGLLLAPGVASGFAISVAFAFLVFLIVVIVIAIHQRSPLRSPAEKIGFSALLIGGLVGWSAAPYLLLPGNSLTYNEYVSPQNLFLAFQQQTSWSTLFNGLTLTGFSWIYTQPDAYSWPIGLITVAGSLSAGLIIVGGPAHPKVPHLGLPLSPRDSRRGIFNRRYCAFRTPKPRASDSRGSIRGPDRPLRVP